MVQRQGSRGLFPEGWSHLGLRIYTVCMCGLSLSSWCVLVYPFMMWDTFHRWAFCVPPPPRLLLLWACEQSVSAIEFTVSVQFVRAVWQPTRRWALDPRWAKWTCAFTVQSRSTPCSDSGTPGLRSCLSPLLAANGCRFTTKTLLMEEETMQTRRFKDAVFPFSATPSKSNWF